MPLGVTSCHFYLLHLLRLVENLSGPHCGSSPAHGSSLCLTERFQNEAPPSVRVTMAFAKKRSCGKRHGNTITDSLLYIRLKLGTNSVAFALCNYVPMCVPACPCVSLHVPCPKETLNSCIILITSQIIPNHPKPSN